LRIDGKVNTRAPPNEHLDWGGSNLQVKIFLALEWILGSFHQSSEISSGRGEIPELDRNPSQLKKSGIEAICDANV